MTLETATDRLQALQRTLKYAQHLWNVVVFERSVADVHFSATIVFNGDVERLQHPSEVLRYLIQSRAFAMHKLAMHKLTIRGDSHQAQAYRLWRLSKRIELLHHSRDSRNACPKEVDTEDDSRCHYRRQNAWDLRDKAESRQVEENKTFANLCSFSGKIVEILAGKAQTHTALCCWIDLPNKLSTLFISDDRIAQPSLTGMRQKLGLNLPVQLDREPFQCWDTVSVTAWRMDTETNVVNRSGQCEMP